MKTVIIAEAGVNHNGDMDIAKRLIDEAKKAGADYVKFRRRWTAHLNMRRKQNIKSAKQGLMRHSYRWH